MPDDEASVTTERRPARTPAPRGGFRIGRILGIEIRLDVSWLFIAFLITFSLAAQLSATLPGRPTYEYWGAAVVGSLLFFSCLLAHELSHSLVARARGAEVYGITLFIFGGISQLKGEPRRPKDEFLIAVVGPLTSAALGAVFVSLGLLLSRQTIPGYAASWLGIVNFALAVFNLLPGYPLDGGRIFRAGVWAVTKDLRRATRIAARIGSGIGIGLMALGAYLFFVSVQFLSGLWITFIGWFLMSAAQRSVTHLELRELLGKYRVRQAMQPTCPKAEPEETVAHLVDDRILGTGARCFLVADGDALLGLVTLQEIKGLGRGAWPTTPVKEVMIPFGRLAVVSPSDSLLEALEKMNERGVNQLPVLDADRILGMVTREDVLRVLGTDMEVGIIDENRSPSRRKTELSRR